MTSEKKPSFLEGLLGAVEPPEDTEGVKLGKEYLEKLKLTSTEKGAVAGWLIGEVMKDSFFSAFEADPPAE